jgi:hypothetical protein
MLIAIRERRNKDMCIFSRRFGFGKVKWWCVGKEKQKSGSIYTAPAMHAETWMAAPIAELMLISKRFQMCKDIVHLACIFGR